MTEKLPAYTKYRRLITKYNRLYKAHEDLTVAAMTEENGEVAVIAIHEAKNLKTEMDKIKILLRDLEIQLNEQMDDIFNPSRVPMP